MLTAQSQAVYSGVHVYEMEVQNIACMRRRSDGWLNATQILKVAGVDKGKRTKVLEKEILVGEHEKVQGGYGKYQGTWISYKRGRQFCRQYGVEEILRPLLDYDVAADGSGGQGQDQGAGHGSKQEALLQSGPWPKPRTFDKRNLLFEHLAINIGCVGGNEQSCTVELPCSEAWNSAETAIQTHVAPREFPRR
jgi:hypothetical protein